MDTAKSCKDLFISEKAEWIQIASNSASEEGWI